MTEKPPDIGNNWVAACVAMWSNTMPKEEIIELMVRKFDIRLMKEMSERINSFEEKLTEVGEKKIVMSLDGVSSTMADRLYEKVLNLKFKYVFYVPFADLSKVPGVKADSQTAKCPPAVSTRLSVVEQRRKRDRAEMEPRTPNFQTMSQKRYLLFNIFCHIYKLDQHPGGAQQVPGPPAPPLISQWQHSDQLSF